MDGIKPYHNKYQGQRAWIIGNGPSLDRTPLDRLEGEWTFGINRIGQKMNSLPYNWCPTFYFCATSYVAEVDYRLDVLKALFQSHMSFICKNLMSLMDGEILRRDIYWLTCLHSSSDYRYIDPNPDWWNPATIEKGVISNYGTSAFACSQILAYMGFNPIFLIGCDLGYKEFQLGQKDPNHFGDDYESGKFHRPQTIHDIDNLRYITSHEIMKRQAKKLGVDIYNATLGGELEVYERRDFFDVI